MLSGYLDEYDPPVGALSILTNYQNFTTGQDDSEVWDEFKSIYEIERRPWDGEFSLIQRIGMWPAMPPSDIKTLRVFLEELKPANPIIEKGVEMMRTMADRPQARGTIGKQISAICLPRDASKTVSTVYHTNVVSHNYFFASQVRAVSDNDWFAISNVILQTRTPSGESLPIAFPKVARNAPCPCGSGKKYKFCHGAPAKKRK